MKLTVLMPVFNGERYLSQAIESILTQTHKEFEFLIVNDGSSDASATIIERYAKGDRRIRTITHESNKGLIFSLNQGIKEAKGNYIARMDADDISLPTRLEKQLQFIANHQNIVVVGSSIQYLDETNSLGKVIHYDTNPVVNGFNTLIFNPVAHPSTLFRKESILAVGGYHSEMTHIEDFDLWSRVRLFGEIANIGEVLLQYRIHSQSISRSNKRIQSQNACKIVQQNVEKYMPCSISQVEVLRSTQHLSIKNLRRILEQSWLQTKLFVIYCHKEKLSFVNRFRIWWSLRLLNPFYVAMSQKFAFGG